MPVVSLKEYAAAIKRSGLLTADVVKQQYESFCASASANGKSTTTAESFAFHLQSVDLLTEWQNSNLLHGKYRGLVFGKFKMMCLLGIGGMGRVFLAEDQMLRRQVALKVLPKEFGRQQSVLQRFHREAQALARLDHPNIVRVHDVDSRDDTHYIVMEYIQGIDLRDKIEQDGPLNDATAADYVRQVAVGLSHAHQNNLIHRDIKPANLLLDDTGTVKILDLGLALLQSDEDGSITADPTQAIGTADYIAPEQALHSHNIDQRTDIYSLGCTLYFFLTQVPPFHSGTNAQRLMAHQVSTPEPVNEVRSRFSLDSSSDALVAICSRMMAKKPEQRFKDCDALRDALESFLKTGSWSDRSTEIETSELLLPEATLPSQCVVHAKHEPSPAKRASVKRRAKTASHTGRSSDPISADTKSADTSVTLTEQDEVRIVRHDQPHAVKQPAQNGSVTKNKSRSSTRERKPKPNALIAICSCLLIAVVGVGGFAFWQRNAKAPAPSQSTKSDPVASSEIVMGRYYVVGDNTTYHCHDCRFVRGKSNVSVATSQQIQSDKYRACGICKPE